VQTRALQRIKAAGLFWTPVIRAATARYSLRVMICMRPALASCASHGFSNDLVNAPDPRLPRTGFTIATVASAESVMTVSFQAIFSMR
jgi:hypothetical protein